MDVLTQGGLSFAGIWAGDGDVGAVVDDESVVFDGVEAREAVGEFALCFGSVFGGAFQKGDVFGIELIESFSASMRAQGASPPEMTDMPQPSNKSARNAGFCAI